jgi:hypothetical protein
MTKQPTSETTQHTPEPWEPVAPIHGLDIRINDSDPLTDVPAHIRRVYVNEEGERCTRIIAGISNGDSDEGAANARRIVACVNACAGLPTEKLEMECKELNTLRAMMGIQGEQLAASGRTIERLVNESVQGSIRVREETAKMQSELDRQAEELAQHPRRRSGWGTT